MPARYFLGAVGSLTPASGTEILTRVRFPGDNPLEETCDGADAGFSTVEFEDPNGDMSIQVWQPFWVTETDCTTDTRIYTGYIYLLTYSRAESLKTTVARKITAQLVDLNGLAKMRVIRGASGKRPIETTSTRLNWLLGSGGVLNGIVYDNGLISVPTVNRDEADYTGQYAADVLSAIEQDGALDAYIIWLGTAAAGHQVTLVVEPQEAAQRASTLKLSNSLTDTTATPSTYYPPSEDATLDRDGSEVYSGVLLRYNGGEIYRQRTATDTTYFGSYGRDWVEDEQRIGKVATATDTATTLLGNHSVPKDTISCKVILPTDKVNLIRAGMALPVRFTHFPGYTSLTTMKVKKRSVRELGHDTTARYELTLELSIGKTISGGGGGGAGGNPTPPPAPATPAFVQGVCYQNTTGLTGDGATISATLSSTPVVGNVIVFAAGIRDGTSVSANLDASWSDYTEEGIQPFGGETSFRAVMAWKYVESGDTGLYKLTGALPNVSYRAWVGEFSGVTGPPNIGGQANTNSTNAQISTTNAGGVTVSVHANSWINTLTSGAGFTDVCNGVTGSSSVPPKTMVAYSLSSATNAATVGEGGQYWGGVIMSFGAGDSQSTPPRAGQSVGTGETPELVGTGDGTTTQYTTRYPYIAGSLHVMVDRLDQTGAVAFFNGTAGTFQFTSPPPVGAKIEVWYQAV